jgi:prepilin peptidase CpaA
MQAALAANLVLIVTAGTLFYVALTDLRQFKIRNEVVAVLAALYVLWALLTGRWVAMHWHVALAAGMFVIFFVAYAHSVLGGGDIKLLTIAFLWTGIECAMVFAVLMLVFALIQLGFVRLNWIRHKKVGDRKKIPFGPAIAGALIVTIMSGCLEGRTWFGANWLDRLRPSWYQLPGDHDLTIENLQRQLNR